jgi:hypothetical protein
VLAHVFEEVFLTPSGEHGEADALQRIDIIGGKDGDLVAVFFELAQFTQPEAVAEEGAAFGQQEGAFFAGEEVGVLMGEKFGRLPVGAGVFVVAEAGDALGFATGEKVRGVSFAVKDEGEAVEAGIGLEGGFVRLARPWATSCRSMERSL